MKIKMIALTLAFGMSAIGLYAQKAPDFSGKWTLDVAKSKLGERNNIESQTLTVTQTANDIKVDTATKRTPPAGGGAPGGGGGMGGGGMGRGGDGAATYMLDGKDMKSEIAGPGGAMVPLTTNGKIDGGKLVLSSSRTFNTPNGAITATSKETWELSADGRTLTVTTERTSPRGTDTTTKVFVKG